MPAGEFKTNPRATVPLAAAVPDERVKESVCAKETFAVSRKAMVHTSAIEQRRENGIMESLSKVPEHLWCLGLYPVLSIRRNPYKG